MAGKLTGKRVAVYARFSSDRQRETSIDDQVRRCREFVEREGGAVAAERLFTDYATSGASLARTGFEALMSLVDAKPPLVDAIVTEDVSRVTRDLADGAMLFKRLQFVGVTLIGVGDGIDTGMKNAKVTYTVKNLVADLYLDDLRDKTMRGLEGRHLAGMSTGNVPFGFTTQSVTSADGREIGRRILILEEQAAVVRRIFTLYLVGRSLTAIAKQLCKDDVAPPRAGTRHRRMGWCDSTVRVILHNEKYIGVWRFKEREWVKVPGEDRRVPRRRDPQDVLTQVRPELRVIDDDTWQAVQDRLAAVRRTYTRNADGSPKGRALSGRMNHYVLSGLIFCQCGAPMVVSGSASSSYYRCTDNVRRATCSNNLGVKVAVAHARILERVRTKLVSDEGMARARKRIAERLGEVNRERVAELRQRQQRLARTEEKIRGLLHFIADKDEQSDYAWQAVRDLEAQAKAEKAAIATLERQAETPVHLPSPDQIKKLVFDLERRIQQDPVAGREWLRRMFKNGRIELIALPERVYLAKSELFPLMLLTENANRRPGVSETAVYSKGSGGRI
jgi:site-specific DNA recombinase